MNTRRLYVASLNQATCSDYRTPSLVKWRIKVVRQRCIRQFRSHGTSIAHRDKPYYVTTPIFYVNAAPHIGHLYSMVLADVVKRWHALKGRHSILCTGTDEHGMKVQRAAAKAGSEPKAFCDQGSDTFKALANKANVANDHFVRTTDLDHREAVQHAWRTLQERGMVYLSKHEGWYSVSDETFYPQSTVHLIVEPSTGRKIMVSMETGKEVEWTSEVNYRFRLSAMKDRLLEFYRQNPNFVVPEHRMNSVVRQVQEGLEDLSISRPSARLSWGVPVPGDESQTIYVWLDALINYITKAGYPWAPGQKNAQGWPADCHVIGKDIVRFHCIYWPAFLLALELSPPKQILSHAHWTLGREKMAKSTGNVVNPFYAIDRFEIDPLRYYLANDGGIAQDADYSNEFIVARYNKDLQGGLGNLASRLTRFKGWNVRQAVEKAAKAESTFLIILQGCELQLAMLHQLPNKASKHFEDLQPGRALREIMNSIFATNAFMQHAQPWKLSKAAAQALEQDKRATQDHVDCVVFLSAEALRLAAILLQPFMPTKAAKLADMLGVENDRRSFEWAKVGADYGYGASKVDLGAGLDGVLFPPLINQA